MIFRGGLVVHQNDEISTEAWAKSKTTEENLHRLVDALTKWPPNLKPALKISEDPNNLYTQIVLHNSACMENMT
jgi:hypothetical protein